MLPTLIPPCTLDPGSPCRDDETLVVFTVSQTINTKSKPKLYPPNPIAVIPARTAGIQLPWMAFVKHALSDFYPRFY